MSILHEIVFKIVRDAPFIKFKEFLKTKLDSKGINLPDSALEDLAKHALSGSGEPFRLGGDFDNSDLEIEISKEEIDNFEIYIEKFQKEGIKNVIDAATKAY